MTGARPPLVAVCASGCFLLMAVLVTARGQQPPVANPDRAFALGDIDLDGRLSLDEFRELRSNGARLKKVVAKKAAGPAAPVFQRLDTDHDGFLSFVEFRRVNQFRTGGGGPFAKAGMARKKAAAELAKTTAAPRRSPACRPVPFGRSRRNKRNSSRRRSARF